MYGLFLLSGFFALSVGITAIITRDDKLAPLVVTGVGFFLICYSIFKIIKIKAKRGENNK